jgi:AcrR family transcriptional regulator
MTETVEGVTHRPARKQRSDGERSRNAILREAALAHPHGICQPADREPVDAFDGGESSGLFAHFGSKQELQLATIETASALFTEQVIEPALAAATGLERLRLLAENFLQHVEGNVYPGGCFFASVAAEMDTRPGPVRDHAVQLTVEWVQQLETAVRDSQTEGAIDPSEDPTQLAFELDAYLLLANAQFVSSQESMPIERARRAVERRLAAAAPGTVA